MRRLGFTMIELIFVIVVMGIIGKFGVEFLAQAYKGFIFTNVNHSLQSNAQMAVESIASKLQYRIKDSIIARQSTTGNFKPLANATGNIFNILEWVGTDIDSFRGNSLPYWSGIIDLDHPNSTATNLVSPETNTTRVNALITNLSSLNSGFADSAIYFIGSDSDSNGYGWNGNAIATQNQVMHPIDRNVTVGQENRLIPRNGNTNVTNSFAGVDVYEYYQLAWTAYAVGISDYNAAQNTGTLRLYADYQPWNGETYLNADINVTLMENVSSFQFKSVGSVIKIQVCVNSKLVNGTNAEQGYSLCKEKTIF